MTIKSLLEQLNKLIKDGADPYSEVVTEGCDCDGDADGIEMRQRWNTKEPYLYIMRKS